MKSLPEDQEEAYKERFRALDKRENKVMDEAMDRMADIIVDSYVVE